MTSYNTKQILEYATDSNFYTESGFNMWHSTNMPRIGEYTEYAFNTIAKNIQKKDPKDFLNTAKKSISSSYEIFSCCNPPYHSIFNPTQGLVVGRVQSGKTTSFSLVSAIAADNNYKIIIHFLGVNDTLLNDNFKSVKKNLGFDNKNLNWKTERIGDPAKKYQNATGLEQGKIKDLVSVLKSSKNKAPWQKKGETILYLYAYKLAPRINQAKKILEELQKHLKPGIPILIIDDEVDSYSVNTNKIVPGKDATATHAALSQLRAVAKNVTYIGYTATTAAIQFAHHTSFLRPQFHAVIDPGPGYVGNNAVEQLPQA